MNNNKNKLSIINKINLSKIFNKLFNQHLTYDNYLNCFCNENSTHVLEKLYGNKSYIKDIMSFRYGVSKIINTIIHSVKKKHSPQIFFDLYLPASPLIFASNSGDVTILISAKENIVAKFQSHIYAKKFCEITKKSWEAFKASEMEVYLPEYLAGGETEIAGTYFTKTRFCPNSPPLFRSYKGRAWPRVLASRVLPILRDFHTRNSFRLLDGAEWAQLISGKYENRKMPNSIKDALSGSLEKIKEFPSKLMPVGMISGDLQPQNIHFYQGRTYILDWSNIETAALLIDVVCDVFYRAMSAHKEINSAAYWDFICGNRSLNETPRVLQDFFKVWRQWVADWMGFQVDEQIYRLQLEGICWDWLGTMIHPWSPEDNSLWEVARDRKSVV